jgi:head-tail adaptor
VVSAQWAVVEGLWDVAPTEPLLTRDPQGQEIEVWPPEKTIVNGRDSAIYAVDASWPPENARERLQNHCATGSRKGKK